MIQNHKALDLIEEHFGSLPDFRDTRGKRHKLLDIIVMAILAIICGADEFIEMEEFGKSKEPFLRTFLELKKGIRLFDFLVTHHSW